MRGVAVFPSVPEVLAGRRHCRQMFSLVPFSLFFEAVAYSRVLEHATSVVSVADADSVVVRAGILGPRRQAFFRACLVVQ